MKEVIKNALFGRNAAVTTVIAVCVIVIAVLGCGKGKDSKPIPSEYVGSWTGSDGSTITIRGDSSGDYKSGGTTVTGGAVSIDEAANTLNITFVGMGPKLKIDKAPSGNQMKLDGIVYKKSGGSDSKNDSSSSKNDDKSVSDDPFKSGDKNKSGDDKKSGSSGDAPSNSEVEATVKQSIEDFTTGVADNDFSVFVESSCKDFQASNTPDMLKKTFAVFLENRDKVLPSLRDAQSASASFSPSPSLSTEKGIKLLTAEGEISSKPNAVKFETQYEYERGEWKILKFKIRM